MFVQIKESTLQEIEYSNVSYEELTVALLKLDEFLDICEELGFDIETIGQLNDASSSFHLPPIITTKYSFCSMSLIASDLSFHTTSRFGIYLMKHLLIIVNLDIENLKTTEAFEAMLSYAKQFKGVTVAQLFSYYLTYFLLHDPIRLEQMELQLEDLEKIILSNRMNIEKTRNQISVFRRKIMTLRNYYEQYITITQSLCENINQLFPPADIISIRLIDSRAKRLYARTQNLSEYLTQIKESYMAQLDISLNSVMKLFTVVTTIFMPLSLIVGWYGMNFKMPELRWEHGYLWVSSLSILVVTICIVIFKKKRFF